MKTPIQELIEEHQQMRENGDNDMRTVIHLAKIILKKEKELLEDVFEDGREEEYQYHVNGLKQDTFEDYYKNKQELYLSILELIKKICLRKKKR